VICVYIKPFNQNPFHHDFSTKKSDVISLCQTKGENASTFSPDVQAQPSFSEKSFCIS
jgi:hypothetical protein